MAQITSYAQQSSASQPAPHHPPLDITDSLTRPHSKWCLFACQVCAVRVIGIVDDRVDVRVKSFVSTDVVGGWVGLKYLSGLGALWLAFPCVVIYKRVACIDRLFVLVCVPQIVPLFISTQSVANGLVAAVSVIWVPRV
jgi:hypothetical protein